METIKILFSPKILLLISLLFLVMGRYVFKKKYLNCFDIIKKHIECFRGLNNRISKVSIFLYFIIPLLIALSLAQIRIIDDAVINILTIIVSILTSMFFTLLTLILDMRKRIRGSKKYNAGDADLSTKILKEVYYSIMFEILVSVVILLLCFIELFSKQYSFIDSLLIYYFTFVLLTNLFMILKRVYKVIDKDLETEEEASE